MMIYFNIRLVWLSVFLAHFQAEGVRNTDYGPEIRAMHIDKVWAQNITGRNVVVAVLDDGVNYNHVDLRRNYEPSFSYDFAENDSFPLPHNSMTHGTQCAGVIAARQHGYCRTGIAYNAKIAGIRLFDGVSVKPEHIVRGFRYKRDVIDIYSNSWGPADNGYTTRRPKPRMQRSLEDGVKFGRKGRGSIFVFSSGNGGRFGDSCAFDGYVNNIYTIAIGAFSLKSGIPGFAERCSSVLAAAYGDNVKTSKGQSCVSNFGRTSAAAAMASGIIALALEANNKLTWRDVQHLIVRTSDPNGANVNKKEWIVNDAGLIIVNPAMGFGVLSAKQLVDAAYNWKTVPQQRSCSIENLARPWRFFKSSGSTFRFSSKRSHKCSRIKALEHVQVEFSLDFLPRGDVEIFLISPQGTKSQLVYKRPLDALDSKREYNNLLITSLHFWGENPTGQWKILLKSAKSMGSVGSRYGTLKMLKVTFYGTEKDPLLDNSLPNGTITCDRRKFWKGYGSQCCGSLSNYDPQNERCCPGTFKVTGKNTRCNSREYNACEKMCCNGVIQNKVKDNVEMICCGTQSYDQNKQVCCGDRLYTRYTCRGWRYRRFIYENKCLSNRYVRWIYTNKPCATPVPTTERSLISTTTNKIASCGSLSSYDPQNERCCPGTYKVTRKNTRCNSREYNACEKLCCNGVIQNKVKNNVEMVCCGTQFYDQNKQVCCGDRLYTRYTCGYRWRGNRRIIFERKCSSNRSIRWTATDKPCATPVRITERSLSSTSTTQPALCEDKLNNCYRWMDCASFRSQNHKRENCRRTCGLC